MPQETAEQAAYAAMGLSGEEYKSIVAGLGREPTYTELGMFAVLWSEHCSYKSSKEVLKLFSRYRQSTEGEGLENAGVVDIGDNIGIAFKIESHNHPSAVEPYEGAATGVGGIIRDVLTMGARPIASLNSLRFGDIQTNPADRRLFDRVVQGIGGYGNCIGVPTIAGEVSFHERYSGNPLVNAMCIGRLNVDKIATATARGEGNPVLYLGSATGRDGIHGATFASEVLDEDSDAKRPNVQIGDPFAGKLLIEATLEALDTGAVVAIQDMGAAGLTCSTCEMSAKGEVGMEINLDLVPLRDKTMTSYEIMLSESQERMLAVVEKGREQEILDIFHKWGLPAEKIGFVKGDGFVTVTHMGKVEARVPALFISDGCPMLQLSAEEPTNVPAARCYDAGNIPETKDVANSLLKLLASPSLASKRWVFEQYDYTVQTQTSVWPGQADAAVLILRGTDKGVSAKVDGNGRWTYADPFTGGQLALIEAARNVACTGALPRAATDCLNFGNPNDPRVYWQFREAVRGIASAAEALDIPVLSGNVSFYNETEQGEVLPTPTVGVVGSLESGKKRIGIAFPDGRGYIYLITGYEKPAHQQGLGASEYARIVHGIEDGAPQPPDLDTEKALIKTLVAAASEELIDAAHDISEGGLAFALAEMCIAGSAGCHVLLDSEEHYRRHILSPVLEQWTSGGSMPSESIINSIIDAERERDPWEFSNRTDARLFGELPGRVLVAVSAERMKQGAVTRLAIIASENDLRINCIGTFDGSGKTLELLSSSHAIASVQVDAMREAYQNSIPEVMQQ